MTNKERLISLLGFAPNQNALDGALIDAGLTGSDIYDPSNLSKLKGCKLEILKVLISTADMTNDNGYVIKYDRAAVQKEISALEAELGLTTVTKSSVKALKVW